ncbi:Protocadherin-9 [Manis javanica]|nr:Protocadherin-9 [Manis javanica]
MHFSEQKPTPLCGLRAVCPRPSRPSERISSLPCHAPPPGAACESLSESQGFCLGAFSISLCSAQKAPPPAPARSCLPSSWSAQTPPCREDLPWRPSCRHVCSSDGLVSVSYLGLTNAERPRSLSALTHRARCTACVGTTRRSKMEINVFWASMVVLEEDGPMAKVREQQGRLAGKDPPLELLEAPWHGRRLDFRLRPPSGERINYPGCTPTDQREPQESRNEGQVEKRDSRCAPPGRLSGGGCPSLCLISTVTQSCISSLVTISSLASGGNQPFLWCKGGLPPESGICVYGGKTAKKSIFWESACALSPSCLL